MLSLGQEHKMKLTKKKKKKKIGFGLGLSRPKKESKREVIVVLARARVGTETVWRIVMLETIVKMCYNSEKNKSAIARME
jgi:hypothetical protein